MTEPRRVGDLLRTRRDLLRLGGLGLLGASIDGVWPLQVSAKQSGAKVQPRGTARNVLFYEMSGAISHVDSYDFKESTATPKDLATTQMAPDLHMSQLLLPKMSKHMDKIAVVRSMQSHEEVHFRAQYYLQTGRQMNLAFAREIPAIGSVIAAELEEQRRPTDTFPTYLSFDLEKGSAGALSTGFLPARFSVVDINTEAVTDSPSLDQKVVELLEERWALLSKLRDVRHKRLSGLGRKMLSYDDFYDAAYGLLSDERWPAALRITEEDKERYGTHRAGVSSILARECVGAGCRNPLHPYLPLRLGPPHSHLGSFERLESLQTLRRVRSGVLVIARGSCQDSVEDQSGEDPARRDVGGQYERVRSDTGPA